MATLSQICILPEGWDVPNRCNERNGLSEVGMSRKLAWKAAKRAEHDRMVAYRQRERLRAERRGVSGRSMESDRRRVYRETMAEPIMVESCRKMFAAGKGQLQPKKAKNSVSREQAGTIGRTIVVKRFAGSRLTCVCKVKQI